jgi:PAS domain S-box-containing protein
MASNHIEQKPATTWSDSEARFRAYFELGLIGMAITSPTTGILEVNDEICKILGYEHHELLRLSWAELTHPDDLAADLALFNRILAGELDAYSLEKRFIRKDGQTVFSTISVKCLRAPDGSVEYFMALLQDITERKAADEALELVRRLPAENPAPVMRLKKGYVVSFANPAAQRLLTVWGLRLGDEAPAEIRKVAQVALADAGKCTFEVTFDNHTFSVCVVPILPGDYVNLYFSDITERKRIEAEREDLLKRLKQSEETLLSKLADLELFHDVVVGRELKMVHLEKEVKRLTELVERSSAPPSKS